MGVATTIDIKICIHAILQYNFVNIVRTSTSRRHIDLLTDKDFSIDSSISGRSSNQGGGRGH